MQMVVMGNYLGQFSNYFVINPDAKLMSLLILQPRLIFNNTFFLKKVFEI